jgi:hypothetical protein
LSFARATLTQSELFNDNRYLIKSEDFSQIVAGDIEFQGDLNFCGDIFLCDDSKLYFRDIDIGLYSAADMFLNVFADGAVLFDTPYIEVDSSNPRLILKDDTNSGNNQKGQVSFKDSAGTERLNVGLIGNGSGDAQIKLVNQKPIRVYTDNTERGQWGAGGGLIVGNGSATNYLEINGSGKVKFFGTSYIDWQAYLADSYTLINGTLTSGNVAGTHYLYDATFLQHSETVTTPGLYFYLEFVNVTQFQWVRAYVNYNYVTGVAHAIYIGFWDWLTSSFRPIHALDLGSKIINFWVVDSSPFIGTGANAGKVRVVFNDAGLGNTTNLVTVYGLNLMK